MGCMQIVDQIAEIEIPWDYNGHCGCDGMVPWTVRIVLVAVVVEVVAVGALAGCGQIVVHFDVH